MNTEIMKLQALETIDIQNHSGYTFAHMNLCSKIILLEGIFIVIFFSSPYSRKTHYTLRLWIRSYWYQCTLINLQNKFIFQSSMFCDSKYAIQANVSLTEWEKSIPKLCFYKNRQNSCFTVDTFLCIERNWKCRLFFTRKGTIIQKRFHSEILHYSETTD